MSHTPSQHLDQYDNQPSGSILRKADAESLGQSKLLRLVEYLIRLASLRTTLVRDTANYHDLLWLQNIPKQKGCFTQAWGRDENFSPEVWIEIQTRREPPLPCVPVSCGNWIDVSALRNKSEIPELPLEITIQVENPASVGEPDSPKYITTTESLADHPEVQEAWDRYLDEHWLPWLEDHNAWEAVHKVYASLFAVHREQLRLGEKYELVLGLGLLTWQTPHNQRVRRHLIVANALIEFEAHLGKFTVRAAPDGASLRPELDMLDIEEQPVRAAESLKSALSGAGDDPWERSCIDGALKALVHSLDASGEYHEGLEQQDFRASSKPVVEYAPALILRERSAKGLTETLKRIKERIEKGEPVPREFGGLGECPRPNSQIPNAGLRKADAALDETLFFPKPSNEEQRRIVDKLRQASGVLVQGPPGTGKSHTIANLICHLLATGQRIMITAKTPRALQVLEGLVPQELRSLCINLLGSGLEEKRSMESSVSGILRKNDEWNEERASLERRELEQDLSALREEKARVERRLCDIRESETQSRSIAQGSYRGTAAQIARDVREEEGTFGWFTDTVSPHEPCPISSNDLRCLLDALRAVPPERQRELSLSCPEGLPSADRFLVLVESEKAAIEDDLRLNSAADQQLVPFLADIDTTGVEEKLAAFSDLCSRRRQALALPYSWIEAAVSDVLAGKDASWKACSNTTRSIIRSIDRLVAVADDTHIDRPVATNVKGLYVDVCKLESHLEAGGSLGWWMFRPAVVRERLHILTRVRVNGRKCTCLEDLSTLADALRVRIDLDKAWTFWSDSHQDRQQPYVLQLHALKMRCDALDNVLSLADLKQECRKGLEHCPILNDPIWNSESQLERVVVSLKVALARKARCHAAESIGSIAKQMEDCLTRDDCHPVAGELLTAIRNRDHAAFTRLLQRIARLHEDRALWRQAWSVQERLGKVAPNLLSAIRQSADHAVWDCRIEQVTRAWHWSQAKTWVHEYIRGADTTSLATRSKQIDDEIGSKVAQLAALRAWSFCFSRLEDNDRRHMAAWQQSMARVGKGTGKHAWRHRQEAQQHLNKCLDAVPAWIMPLHRVWDTVDPSPGMFDVIIVDEASQCGVEALPLFYLGKKILVVGDDKQISPDAVGTPRDAVHRLMEELLFDFDFGSAFDIESSLFDHGKRQFGVHRITLREHFRCMPEIIRFSNDLCYHDTPLVPLRQYGQNRLTPLEHVFVDGGYRQGTDNRVINRPEAEAIADRIVALCGDQRYQAKTIGVVVLQGDAQAALIEQLLLERLGAEEMQKRHLVCGNPYSFQGDERDVMFLSMVAANNERIGTFTKPADERRFNVAASRARDQMLLFHSVTRQDLGSSCLRRKLLDFFEDTQPQAIAGISREDLEHRAASDNRQIIKPPDPFESWFEVDVALELLRRKYTVIPQVKVAGKRIDLVVQGEQTSLAVECDGDAWHGADRYEADMHRQRMLERCGWQFYRIRESHFYADPVDAMQGLWEALADRGICPPGCQAAGNNRRQDGKKEQHAESNSSRDDVDRASENTGDASTATGAPGPSSERSRRRAEDMPAAEIQKAIVQALSKCPNCSCTEDSLTTRVLRELGIRTAGQPRKKFEARVRRSVNALAKRGVVEKYRAKNQRVRLCDRNGK